MLTVTATQKSVPPTWALLQRHLIEIMNEAGHLFLDKNTREDGTIVWREHWPGMDGSDDAYESFYTFPLFYALGGAEDYRHLGRKQWEAVTWQFTEYGQLYREFDAYYDWMHHGEAYTFLHYFGMADPNQHVDRQRALNFAAMYMGEDPEARNYDPEYKIIRSPINGGAGPCFEMTAEDWHTHRGDLSRYLAPYEDIPGIDGSDPFVKADWTDDTVLEQILKLMNERMVPGDVPLNLNATSLISNAFLYTGEEKYRAWAARMADWFVGNQRDDGHWENTKFWNPEPTLSDNIHITAEFVMHVAHLISFLALPAPADAGR